MHTAIPCCTINGEQPALRGQVCQSLLIQEWWWEGRPADPVNVVYLQFEQRWYRLYFEGETVFWRSGEAPRPCENDEGPGEYRLHDLGRQRGLVGSAAWSACACWPWSSSSTARPWTATSTSPTASA
ncbi:hypothetical protein QOT71_24810 [Pseudomonas aeruginosa]